MTGSLHDMDEVMRLTLEAGQARRESGRCRTDGGGHGPAAAEPPDGGMAAGDAGVYGGASGRRKDGTGLVLRAVGGTERGAGGGVLDGDGGA